MTQRLEGDIVRAGSTGMLMMTGPQILIPRRTTYFVLVLTLALSVVFSASCSARQGAPVAEQGADAGAPTAAAARGCAASIHGDLRAVVPNGQVLTYWHPYTGDQERLLHTLVDEFNRTNGFGIVVLAESQGSPARLHRSIAGGVETGRLPDLATSQPGFVATYAGQRALTPLDCYATSPQWGYTQAKRDDFYAFALSAGYLPQLRAQYGWPFHTSAEVMVYNADWLAELGYDGPPATWEEFSEMACAASQQPFSDSRGEGVPAGYEVTIDARRFATFVLSRGGAVINEDNSAYVFGGQEGLDALALLRDLMGRGCAQLITVRGEDQVDFSAGRVLFAIAPVHHLPEYRKAVEESAGFGWDIVPPPHHADRDGPTMHIYGPSFAILRSNPERQLAAWLFVRWMSEPEQQALWAISTSYYPTRQAAVDLMVDYFTENPRYERAIEFATLEYRSEPAVPGYDGCRVAVEQMLTGVLSGGDAQTALDAAAMKCTESLE